MKRVVATYQSQGNTFVVLESGIVYQALCVGGLLEWRRATPVPDTEGDARRFEHSELS